MYMYRSELSIVVKIRIVMKHTKRTRAVLFTDSEREGLIKSPSTSRHDRIHCQILRKKKRIALVESNLQAQMLMS
jgi:hypothetical protein